MNFSNIRCKKIFHSSVDGYKCHSDGLRECLPETSQPSDSTKMEHLSQ